MSSRSIALSNIDKVEYGNIWNEEVGHRIVTSPLRCTSDDRHPRAALLLGLVSTQSLSEVEQLRHNVYNIAGNRFFTTMRWTIVAVNDKKRHVDSSISML